jgi:hypothetical protein
MQASETSIWDVNIIIHDDSNVWYLLTTTSMHLCVAFILILLELTQKFPSIFFLGSFLYNPIDRFMHDSFDILLWSNCLIKFEPFYQSIAHLVCCWPICDFDIGNWICVRQQSFYLEFQALRHCSTHVHCGFGGGGGGLETVCRRFKNCKLMCRNADYVSVGLWLMHKINEVWCVTACSDEQQRSLQHASTSHSTVVEVSWKFCVIKN